MTARIHFFALLDPYSTQLFCGDFREGDGWTALPHGVTCVECRRRLDAFAASSTAAAEAPTDQHAS